MTKILQLVVHAIQLGFKRLMPNERFEIFFVCKTSMYTVHYNIPHSGFYVLVKRPLGRPRCRWQDNIKMDLQEVRRGCGDWMELAQDMDRWQALVSTVMKFRVP